ncbi:MAG: CBS domain-containing protein [Planctomycetota bacterium]|nr:CBS domain-containing protein [Planctomycetota bacterium]
MNAKRAADIMTQPVVTVGPNALLTDAIELLLRHHVSGLPVVGNNGEMVGIITEHDILNFAISGNAADTRVEEAMTTEVIWMPPDTEVTAVINCLASRHLRRVPVVQGGKVVGIVSRRDILREMLFMYSKYH